MEDEWSRDRVVRAHQERTGTNTALVPPTSDGLDAAADPCSQYEALNVFDEAHLGSGSSASIPAISSEWPPHLLVLLHR
jgi:hypothetical protein